MTIALARRPRNDRARAPLGWMMLVVSMLSVSCSETARARMPAFPTPTPSFSTRATLKRGLVLDDPSETLGDVFDRIQAALARGGFAQWSVYALSDDGFAVVTRMEQIEDDGRPRTPRFTVRPPFYRARTFSVDDHRRALFNAEPGRYRMFALVVTAHSLTAEQRPPPAIDVDAGDLAKGRLPSEMRRRRAPNGRCDVLVFELVRPEDASRPAELDRSDRTTALEHVARAGLWEAGELAP